MRQFFAIALIASLAALTYVSACAGLADVHFKFARLQVSQWRASHKAPGLHEWRDALNRMRRAQLLEPQNPNFTEGMGALYDWGAKNKPLDNPAAVSFSRQALDYFRTAARQRPSSSYTWSNIALTKARLGQIDSEYFAAVKHVAFLGPWEGDAQLTVADAALSRWGALPDDVRTAARRTLERTLKHHPKEVLEIARRYKLTALVCTTPGAREIDCAAAK